MPSSLSDPFERIAAECGLQMTAEALYAAPRDVMSPPPESDQHFLITIGREQRESAPLRLIFETPLSEPAGPSIREVLWWLAGDAWAVDQAGGRLDAWASSHGFSPRDVATKRLFERHLCQVAALKTLLGDDEYRRLLSLYSADVGAGARTLRKPKA